MSIFEPRRIDICSHGDQENGQKPDDKQADLVLCLAALDSKLQERGFLVLKVLVVVLGGICTRVLAGRLDAKDVFSEGPQLSDGFLGLVSVHSRLVHDEVVVVFCVFAAGVAQTAGLALPGVVAGAGLAFFQVRVLFLSRDSRSS